MKKESGSKAVKGEQFTRRIGSTTYKVMDMYGEQRSITQKLKPIERRLKVLGEHILNAENYFRYRDIYRKYKQQETKKQEAFCEKHRMELTHYEAAERYLNTVMNGKTRVPGTLPVFHGVPLSYPVPYS